MNGVLRRNQLLVGYRNEAWKCERQRLNTKTIISACKVSRCLIGDVIVASQENVTMDGGEGNGWDKILLGLCEYGDKNSCPMMMSHNF